MIWASIITMAALVGLLSVLVVGLLRSHAVIIRALHEAGVKLDPHQIVDRSSRPSPAQSRDHAHDHSHGSDDEIDLRPIVELETIVAPTITTVDGVPEPAGVSGGRGVDLVGQTVNGGLRSISILGGDDTLIAFLSTGCSTCAGFWNAFGEGVRLPPRTRLVIVTKGGNEESLSDVDALAPAGTTTILSSEAWDDYQVPVAPYFALVESVGGRIIGEGAAHSWDLVEQLLHRAVADTAAAAAAKPINRRSLLKGKVRSNRIDDELIRAGITPGDPRLHHETPGGES